MSARSGGPTTCTFDLLQSLYELNQNEGAGNRVDLLTFDLTDTVGREKTWMKLVPDDRKTPVAYSHNIRHFLGKSDYDLYHCNAIWMYSNHITCATARKKGKPYVLSTHGMLYPTALKVSAWKKWPMLKLWFNRDIHSTACIHATCMQEMEHVRAFGYKGPIAVIANPVVFPEGVEVATSKPVEKRIGFLGRLHPIKKVENLLHGAAKAKAQGCEPFTIEIMGKGLDDYERFLHQEVERLGLTDCVNFVGFVNGAEKYTRLGRLHALMVPSEQENFGMIVPEALICGTPVYASKGTPWEELNEYGCGWWNDNSPETIAQIIREITEMSNERILEMGKRGRSLIERKYKASIVALRMQQLYEWLINGGIRPEFVYVQR